LVGGGAGFEGDEVVGGSVGGVTALGGFGDDGFDAWVVQAGFDVEVADSLRVEFPRPTSRSPAP